MDAAGGHSEDEVIACLRYLREERGLRPGTKNGPRHLSWFKTEVADYFAQKPDRELVTGNGPVAVVAGALPREVFQSMTGPGMMGVDGPRPREELQGRAC
jgi:hypothetical protein